MDLGQAVSGEFHRRFGGTHDLVLRAPGRVNLIGEHTDYNDGFVLPMTIDRALWIALRRRGDEQVHAYSIDQDQAVAFSLRLLRQESSGWAEYLKGVAWALQSAGYRLSGWEGVVAGDVPVAAGLSSSAALELVTARAFAAVSGLSWEAKSMARLCQRAENQWVGVNCGIMDQMISALGEAKHALLIDCRSLETQAVPLPPGTAVVVLDTATRRGLVDSAYNERRAQCEAAAQYFGVPALRDVTTERFEAEGHGLDELTYRRTRHVVTENERALRAAATMQKGDAAELGLLMNASHASLRDDFAVSSHELDAMVACALDEAGCYGARMTGAGFGGCAVALIQADSGETFATRVAARYRAVTGIVPQVYVCTATDGAQVVSGS